MIYDFIVIGSGIAGLSTARLLATHGRVAVLTKRDVQDGATQYAQGGIAAALSPDDAPQIHFQDTIMAGDGLCDEAAVKILVEEGPERVRELIGLGAHFDKNGPEFDLTKEAAHSKRRILHAKDATGLEIERALHNNVSKNSNVTFWPNTFVLQLLRKKDTIIGCLATNNGEQTFFYARAIILATGGYSQLFERNTNPPVVTGDGIAMAHRAGAKLMDMEFTQFHPTTLYLGDKKPISLFLISEAVRGEGAILRNSSGERFMPNYHPNAELAPRDIVARAIFFEAKKTDASHVFLDVNSLKDRARDRFPNIAKRCLDAKIDITRDLIPVSPAAHYSMGGIKTDTNGQTNLAGLYAVGEASSSGLHGANRLASNSLLDGLVFGARAAHHAAAHLQPSVTLTPAEEAPYLIQTFLTPEQESQLLPIKAHIKSIMWEHVGIVRSKTSLDYAAQALSQYAWLADIYTLDDRIAEIQHLYTLANLVTTSALLRTESRGSHYREDFPERDDKHWTHHLIV